MFGSLAQRRQFPDLRQAPRLHGLILALYRFGSYVPVPGINSTPLRDFFDRADSTSCGVLNLFAGGALANLSLFALGIMPYITATIIMQLMTVVIPSLEKLQKEGETGQKKITQYTRYLTVVLAPLQSMGYVSCSTTARRRRQNLLPDLTPRPLHPDRHLADGRHDAADVARRADHPARHRQRHLAADLRLDPDRGPAGGRRLAQRRRRSRGSRCRSSRSP